MAGKRASTRSHTLSTNSKGRSEATLIPEMESDNVAHNDLEKSAGPGLEPVSAVSPPSIPKSVSRCNSIALSSRPLSAATENRSSIPSRVFEPIQNARSKKQKRKVPRVERAEDPHDYPGPFALTLLSIGLCLSVFLVSLDRTIVATAIPRITDDFHSPDDVGWYGSAYLITAGALQPLYGRIFTSFNIKWAYLVALGVFELGSLICGVAPNSVTLIFGRAIAGWGSAGIITGSFVAVAHAVPLRKRPVFSAAVGTMFGAGAIVGPLLGGAFTEFVTWRWCFYFNLPVCGATVLSMIFLFKPHKEAQESQKTFVKKLLGLDLIGNFFLIVAAVMLFLALQLQEIGSAWSDSRIVGLLVGAGLTAIVFCIWQWRMGEAALLPGKIVLQRSVSAGCVAAFFIYGTILLHAYYLPIWFQAIKGASAVQSGVYLIPYMIANALFSVIAGIAVGKIGYFTPPAIIGAAIGTIGCGLLSTLQVHSGPGKWIGYQILVSAGLGMAVQQGVIAVQTVLPLDKVPIGVAAVVSMQSLGGAIFVSVGNSILQNMLEAASAENQLPGINISEVIAAGATQFRSMVPSDSLPALLVVYNSALQKVFTAAIPLAGLAALAALALEWKSVRKQDQKKNALQAGITHLTTEYSMAQSMETCRSRRFSEDGDHHLSNSRSRGSAAGSASRPSFETARTSLSIAPEPEPEPGLTVPAEEAAAADGFREKDGEFGGGVQVTGPSGSRMSQISVPGSWCDE